MPKRDVKVGDLIAFTGSGQHQLVVSVTKNSPVEQDASLILYTFDTIDAEVFHGSDRRWSKDPKVSTWKVSDQIVASIEGDLIQPTDFRIVGTAKVKAEVTTSYDWFNIRYFKT